MKYRWPPWRKAAPPAPPGHLDKAAEALQLARIEQVRARKMWPQVNEVVAALERERQINHFAERFAAAFGRTKE